MNDTIYSHIQTKICIMIYIVIFEESEDQKLRYQFERSEDRRFAHMYDQCKMKCPDPKFEKFYKDWVHGLENRKPCH